MTQAVAIAQSGSNNTTFRNRIINGAMMIDQRNAGASVNNDTSGTQYTLDRWLAYGSSSSKFSIQQNAGSVTPPVGFKNYLGVTSLAATSVGSGDIYLLQQPIEGLNTYDLGWGTANAKPVTLSFWVYSSLTGTFGGSLVNSDVSRSYPYSYSVSAANTWTQVNVTIPGDTSGTWLTTNGIGIRVYFGLGIGSTRSGTAGSWAGADYRSATGATSVVGTSGATFYITGVQLEKGTVATPFEQRLYGTELSLCYRYYRRYNSTGAYTAWGPAGVTLSATVIARIGFPLDIPMRTAPTVSFSSCVGWNGVIGGAASIVTSYCSPNNIDIDVSTSGLSAVAGYAGKVLMSGASAYVELTGAEL